MFKETSIGIDFGGYSMKVSAFIKRLDEYVKKEYVMSAEISDVERYFEEARKNILSFKKENKINFAILSISLPSNVRFLSGLGYADMPAQKDKILRKALGFEIQKDMSLNTLNNHEYLFEKIGNFDDENGNENVTLLYNTLSKDILSELKKFVGVKTKIANIFLHPVNLMTKADKSAVLIDFGYENIRIYMYENGILQSLETVEFGESNIDGALRRVMGPAQDEEYLNMKKLCSVLTMEDEDTFDATKDSSSEMEERYREELEKYKNSFGVNDASFSERSRDELIRECSLSITEEVSEVIQRIKQIVRAYEISKDIVFENFYTLGGLTNLRNLNAFLSDEFSMDVNHLNKHRDFLEFASSEEEQNFIVASALSHRGNSDVQHPLNFKRFARFTVDMIPILIGLLCITMMVNGISYKINQDYNKKIEELTGQFETASRDLITSTEEHRRMTQEISEVEYLVNSANKIEIQKKWLSDVFKVLKEITPSELLIFKIDSKSNTILFHGFSSNYSDIGFFSLALEKYGNVAIKSIEKAKDIKILNTENGEIELVEEFFITLDYKGKLMGESFRND